MSTKDFVINKFNIDSLLKDFAREYKKRIKNQHLDVIIVGGASVLINYDFRNTTTDIDAFTNLSSVFKESIYAVADKHNLPNDWLNNDFKNTSSYTPKLIEHAKFYKTYSNHVHFYTIDSEYLIAMKLKSGRVYKNDLSDILGILIEHYNINDRIEIEDIKKAYNELYGDWDSLDEKRTLFIENIMKNENYLNYFDNFRDFEKSNKAYIINIEDSIANKNDFQGVLKELKDKMLSLEDFVKED